jgi:hypothetical protein
VKSQYAEALLFTLGATSFSIASQKTCSAMDNSSTEPIGIFVCLLYQPASSTAGRTNVDTFQMMLGVSILDTTLTTLGFLASGDFGVVHEFFQANRHISGYIVIATICSTLGTFCTLYILQEFGLVVLTILMPWMGMIQMCISVRYTISAIAVLGAVLACVHPCITCIACIKKSSGSDE